MRTLESFHHHLETTVANCHTSWIVLKRNTLLGDEYIITPHLCKSNYCDVCRPKNLINLTYPDTTNEYYETFIIKRNLSNIGLEWLNRRYDKYFSDNFYNFRYNKKKN